MVGAGVGGAGVGGTGVGGGGAVYGGDDGCGVGVGAPFGIWHEAAAPETYGFCPT